MSDVPSYLIRTSLTSSQMLPLCYQEQKDAVLATGVGLRKGVRDLAEVMDTQGNFLGPGGDDGNSAAAAAAEVPVDYRKEFEEQVASQEETASTLVVPMASAGAAGVSASSSRSNRSSAGPSAPKSLIDALEANDEPDEGLLTCQEYLREVVIRVRHFHSTNALPTI